MQYLTDYKNLKLNNTVVTIGKFDGNHVGHRLLFDTVSELKEFAMDAVVFTFSDGIKNYTKKSDRSIMTNYEKRHYDYPPEIDYVIECRFDDELKNMLPEEFIEKILVKHLGVKKVVVGNDFRFGKERSGDVKTLFDLSSIFRYEVFPVEKIRYNGTEVSSTYIKEKISEGDIKAANDMLGEPFSVTGKVVHGKELGRMIGFPTINFIAEDEKILPPDGVYATKTYINGAGYKSITNIGLRPTTGENLFKTVETHIFDYEGDLYDETIRVDFYKFIRPEKKFDGLSSLKDEIDSNINEVKDYFKKYDI